jgi:CheY-like chemotaxis protein
MARILVVEDNPQNLKLTKVILEAAGHQVVGAPTASEAESAIAERTPDLILMDLALPGKDGYTLTRELRRRPPTEQLPILAVSSFAMPGDAERALAAGCTAYLTKPIHRAILLQHVDELLGSGVRPSAPPSEGPDGTSAPRGASPGDDREAPTHSSPTPEGVA